MSKFKYGVLVKTLINLAWPYSASACMKVAPMPTYFRSNDQNKNATSNEKFAKYWPPSKSVEEILEEADRLYEEKNYIQVYEILNRLKYNNNSNVKWRIARVLYQATVDNVLPLDIEREMINEAYELLLEEATIDNKNANVHKWFAIACDCRHRLLGLEHRIRGYHTVLKHLRLACELNPDDVTACYLLGKLCFDMADLGGLKRLIAKVLYGDPPDCNFEEAYKYLSRFDQLFEKNHLASLYLLGKTCYKLQQFYKAKYYLSIACYITPRSECEKNYVCRAKQLLVKLEKYKLGKDVLFPDCGCRTKT
ncbi:hypothetical protein WA026_001489 [Henosepilachna vigintioctopunctata]|uniref:Regulator of microtubule dynamics protein 1 n=1 Tax=Henosepilachna vigintioctopunctata TaxID=420089 RepID=A0AAW1UJV0_9CUCU